MMQAVYNDEVAGEPLLIAREVFPSLPSVFRGLPSAFQFWWQENQTLPCCCVWVCGRAQGGEPLPVPK